MLTVLKTFFHIIIICILTVISQIGGLIYLLCIPIWRFHREYNLDWKLTYALNLAVFLLLIAISSLFIIPPIASKFGRQALPIRAHSGLQPINVITVLLNRHYVKPELRATVLGIAKQFKEEDPRFILVYMDAGFPFIDGFPLLPHLSHDDGHKLDLAFHYKNSITEKTEYGVRPSYLGYGACEGPLETELSQPEICERKGFWQYNILHRSLGWSKNERPKLDEKATGKIIRAFAAHKDIRKIFLEPHLTTRLGLESYSKIRFHGCRAVRHDDHFHVQL